MDSFTWSSIDSSLSAEMIRKKLSQFLSHCIRKLPHSSRRDPQGAANFHNSKGHSNSGIAVKHILAIVALVLSIHQVALAAEETRTITVNGDFEKGLTGWRSSGDVAIEKVRGHEGHFSVRIGPGAGSITQRVAVGSGNHMMLSVLIDAASTGTANVALRFLDGSGKELMVIDSDKDIKPGKEKGKISDYLKPHPLTESVEIVVSKTTAPGYVLVNQVKLETYTENDPSLKGTGDLAEIMKPLWKGNVVSNEAVLMMSRDGKPGLGTLMFQPTRILSVTDYAGSVHYREGVDFTSQGRTLICTPDSRMTQIKSTDLLKGDLQWNVVGGKQVLVTYEHSDPWTGPAQSYVGEFLPNTMQKLTARAPLKIVAFGDSITFGLGSSRMLKIPPFQAPWIELFTNQLSQIYRDPSITLYNSSQSGADSNWARTMAQRMVASLHPDLVLIAFGQNDFWSVSPDVFVSNISSIIQAVRSENSNAEFLLVSPMRFDPAYSVDNTYWDTVSQYDSRLRALTGVGVQLVDMTAISGAVFAAKSPKDSLNDPLHPNDYLSRWYAQSAVAALSPVAAR
jgi:lysophospholipase L1-like esterase